MQAAAEVVAQALDVKSVLDFQSPAVIGLGSFVLTHVLELAKRSKFIPWLSQFTTTKNRVIVILYSLLTAFGIDLTWTYDVDTGGFFKAQIPGLAELVNGAWAWLTSEACYKLFVQKPLGVVEGVGIVEKVRPLVESPRV